MYLLEEVRLERYCKREILHVYLILEKNPTYTTKKRVGKIIFCLVPTRLFGTTRLLDSEKISILHVYSIPYIT